LGARDGFVFFVGTLRQASRDPQALAERTLGKAQPSAPFDHGRLREVRAGMRRQSCKQQQRRQQSVEHKTESATSGRARRTENQPDELGTLRLIDLHSMPASRTRALGYRTIEAMSGGKGAISQPANPI
jgi:hypothetical protein